MAERRRRIPVWKTRRWHWGRWSSLVGFGLAIGLLAVGSFAPDILVAPFLAVRPVFDFLPDLVAFVFAMLGFAFMFIPEILAMLSRHRHLRLVIAVVTFLIGLGALVSSSVQKQEAAEAAKTERDTLMNQVSNLIEGQQVATTEATGARQEAQELRAENTMIRKELADAKATIEGKIASSELLITENINQYRTDTTTAVGRILRPPRTLASKRQQLVQALRATGPSKVSITIARGNQEVLTFYGELVAVFKEADWEVVEPMMRLIQRDGTGLSIFVKDTTDKALNPQEMAVALAFKSIGMQLIGIKDESKADDTVELYVGLQ